MEENQINTAVEPEVESKAQVDAPEQSATQEAENKPQSESAESQSAPTEEAAVPDAAVAVAQEQSVQKQITEPVIDNSTPEEILVALRQYAGEAPVGAVSRFATRARARFYQLINQRKEAAKEKFVAEGGLAEDFLYKDDATKKTEEEFKTLTLSIEESNKREQERLEKEREQNLLIKQNIIENFRAIVEKGESSRRYTECRQFQDKWKQTGPVPAASSQEINNEYKRLLNQYYEQVKIDRALRENDQKRNIDAKEMLIAQAEKLLEEKNFSKAYHAMQELFNQWKEIGFVPRDKGEELWERFSKAKSTVNKNFRQHIDSLHQSEQENYKIKQALCEELEEILKGDFNTNSVCDIALNKMKNVQERWRKAGFAPKNVSEQIFARYRELCERIHARRREFFKGQDANLQANLQQKEELCKQAEALQDSEDWKQTANTLKGLQAKWKEIGPVPRKVSDDIWKRFRAACDHFFERKDHDRDDRDGQFAENLLKKQALIEEIKAYDAPEDEAVYARNVKEFQQRWNAIGFVPSKDKEAINREFGQLMDKHYDKLHVDAATREAQQLEGRLDALEGEDALYRERERVRMDLRKAENDLAQVQNNAGFFANMDDDKIKRDIQKNIDRAQRQVDRLKAYIKAIDAKLKA